MILLDGRKIRDEKISVLRERVLNLKKTLQLIIINIGNNKNSKVYIDNKVAFGKKIGVEVIVQNFDENEEEKNILEYVKNKSEDEKVNGIIVQLPIPEKFDKTKILSQIDWRKDVDGLTAENVRKLVIGDSSGIVPATARGVLSLLTFYNIPIDGKNVVIIGRSLLVGKSTALNFLNHDATVMICHSKTDNLEEKTKNADILVVAVGNPKFISSQHVSSGQVVVDVGITANGEGQIVGDVDFEAVKDTVFAISPVPNGVGPMTVLSLFENLIDTASKN